MDPRHQYKIYLIDNKKLKMKILSILTDKIALHIAANKTGKLCRQLLELFIGLTIGAVIISPDFVSGLFWAAISAYNFAFIKSIFLMGVFFKRKSVIRFFRSTYFFAKKRRAENLEEKFLDNIPIPELTDYLIRNRHFRREGVNGVRMTFGLNMERYNKLAKNLEDSGVLVRGTNNGRILDAHWSRQSLFDFLSGYYESADMIPRFTINRIRGGKVRLDLPAIPAGK